MTSKEVLKEQSEREYQREVDKFRLEDRVYGDIHSHMWKLGYRNHHEPECRVFHVFNKEVYDMIVDTSFLYTCHEAEYLGLEKKGALFEKMCTVNHCDLVNSFCYMIPGLYGKPLGVKPLTEHEMKMEIHEKYNGTDKDKQGNKKIKKFTITIFQQASDKKSKKKGDWQDDGEDWKDGGEEA